MLGRSAELTALRQMLQRVVRGAGEVAVVEGEAGIGKSRLLAEVLDCAEELGFAIYQAAAQELEHDRPFGAIADAFELQRGSSDGARAHLGDLLFGKPDKPDGTRLLRIVDEAPELRFTIVEAVLDLVRDLAARQPVALFFDDLHWADSSSVLTLHRIARDIAELPVALVCAARPSPRSQQLETLVSTLVARGSLIFRLPPLDQELATALVIDALGAVPGPKLRRIVTGAAGNPLFILELLRALIQEGTITFSGGEAEIASIALPAPLRTTILTQLRTLPSETVDVLRAASVLGSSFSLGHLSAVVKRPDVELVPTIERARAVGLIAEAGSRLTFRHDIVREAIYQEMSEAARKTLHAAAGRELARLGAPASQVATHMALGAAPGDAETIAWLRVAARETAPLAPPIAAELLERAVDLCDPETPERDSTVAELVAALVWSGRLTEAEEAARGLLMRRLDESVARDVELGLAHALLLQGRWNEAAERFRALSASQDLSDASRARLLGEESLARVFSLDLDGARAAAQEAIRLGENVNDDLPVTLGLQARAMAAHYEGSIQQSVDLARRAVSVAEESSSHEAKAREPHLALGFVLMYADHLDEAEEAFRAGQRAGEQLGIVWHLPVYHWLVGIKHFYAGEWAEAIEELDAALAAASDIETSWDLLNLYGTLAQIALRRGDFSATRKYLARADEDEPHSHATVNRAWFVWAQGLFLDASGDPAAAVCTLSRQWDELDAHGVAGGRWIGPDLVRVALASGERARARSVTDTMEPIAAKIGTSSARGAALLCRGLLQSSADTLLQAAAAYRDAGRPLFEALALEHAAVALSERASPKAVTLLGQAADIYERLGASYELARTEAHLRERGMRRARARQSARPEHGWESLTEAERRVVNLAAQGLTNPEIARRLFVSPRTVATHLKHAFGKLGVSSRVELAALVARRGPHQR